MPSHTLYENGIPKEEHNMFTLPGNILDGIFHPDTPTYAIKSAGQSIKIFNAISRVTNVGRHRTDVHKSSLSLANKAMKWIKWAVDTGSEIRTVKCKPLIFKPEQLHQPTENPNQLNKKAWSQFYSAMKCLRNNTCRDTREIVTPSQFHRKQQAKLQGMVTPEFNIAKQYIDEISSKATISNLNSRTNFKEVKNVINNLSSSGAYDTYDISSKNIKQMGNSKEFINTVVEIWNLMVEDGTFPQNLKMDRIIYLWKKKGEKDNPKFYRPITLVVCLSKIMEGLLHLKIKLSLPLPANNIQHAYKPERSIQTALLDLDEKLTLGKKKVAAVIFLDLKGAFESVDHKSLIYYINKFAPTLAKISKSYLTNRLATVYSRSYPDDSPRLVYTEDRSVPQGSKVSPTLFSIATGLALNWLNERLTAYQQKLDADINMVAYADDVAITVNVSEANKLSITLPIITKLFKRIMNIFGGDLEPSKTEILVSDNTLQHFKQVIIEENTIEATSMVKWLGFHIKINNNSTIKVVIPDAKIYALLNSINLFHLYNNNVKDNRNFYMTYIRPIIDFWLCIPTLEQNLLIIENRLIIKTTYL